MAIQLEDLVARLRLDTSGVATGLRGVDSTLSSVGDKATNAGRKLTLGVTTPLVGIGIAATNLAAGFDKTMRQVAIATGGPSEALSKLAMQMGAETAFSAGEAADAMLELAKGGMTAAQIQGGALAATMKLASAGQIGLADASTYVSNSMAAFGLSAKDADSVTVALAGAANASSASVESLGMGLSQAAASARNAGLSLQETTGVLSLFDSLGLKGSDAGTSLKSMLNSLIPTTDKARQAMADANLDFVDAEGNFVSVANMAEQLKRGLGGLSEAQRAQALETIFGSDGMRAASALMQGGAKAVRDYTQASRDQKTTTELANAAMEGTSGAMERAKGSIETAGLVIGQVLAPYVERAAGFIERLANAFVNLPGPVQAGAVGLAAVAAAVGPLLIALGFIASSLSSMIGLFTATGAAAGVAVAPFIAVGVVVAALAAGFVLLYQRSETFRTAVQAGAAQIMAAFSALLAAVQPIIQQIVGVFAAQLPQIRQTISSVFASVVSIVQSAMSIVRSVIQIATAAIRQVWATFGETILTTISRVLSSMQTVIRGAFNVIAGIFRTVAAALRGDWSGAWDGIKQIASGALGVLRGLISGGLAVIRGLFSALWDVLQSLAASGWEAIKQTFSGGVAKAVGAVRELPAKIKGVFSGALTLLAGIGEDIVQGLINGIRSAAGRVADAAASLVDKIPGPIRKIMGIASPSKVMFEIGGHIGDGLALGISAKAPVVGDAAEKAADAAKERAERHKKKLEAVGKILSDGFAEGIAGGRAHVIAEMKKLTDAIEKTGNDAALKTANTAGKTLRGLGRQYGQLRADLADAQRQLAGMEEARKAVEKRQAALSAAGGDLTSLTFGEDENGIALPPTAESIIAGLQAVNQAAIDFDTNLVRLRDAGLSQDALDQLIAKGPEAAGATALAILQGGQAAINQINVLQSTIANTGLAIQAKSSQNMYDVGVAAQQGLIAGLESQMETLEAQMTKIAKAMAKAIKKALKIKSPSRVMRQLGDFTGTGFALGLRDTVKSVERASSTLANAALIDVKPYDPAALNVSARRTARATAAATTAPTDVRVFIGDRELTDIVDVQIGSTLAPLQTATRQGAW